MSEADQEDEGAARPRGGGGPSEKQLNFIASLQKRIGLGEDELEELLQEVAQVGTVEELDRKTASEVIDQLMVEAKDRGVDLDSQPKASDKQVGFMKQLKRRAHLTDEEFAKFLEERAGVTEPEEVGKRDASTIIDELLKLADGGAKGGGAKGAKGGEGGTPGPTATSAASRPKKAPKGPAPGANVEETKPKGPAPKKKKAAPAPEPDDDRPPDRAPPPEEHEPGSFDDETDDADLDRDPGPGDRPPDDDDLPF